MFNNIIKGDEIKMPEFTYYWNDGKRNVFEGVNPNNALFLAGFGSNVLRTLNFFMCGNNHDYKWENSKWEKKGIKKIKSIEIISRRKIPGEIQEDVSVVIKNILHTYSSQTYWIDKLDYMLKKGAGFKALNLFKKHSTHIKKEGKICPPPVKIKT